MYKVMSGYVEGYALNVQHYVQGYVKRLYTRLCTRLCTRLYTRLYTRLFTSLCPNVQGYVKGKKKNKCFRNSSNKEKKILILKKSHKEIKSSFETKLNFRISISWKPNGVNLCYLKLRLI